MIVCHKLKILFVNTICILFVFQAYELFECRMKELACHSDLGESHSAAFTFRSVHALDGRFTFVSHNFYPLFILLGGGLNIKFKFSNLLHPARLQGAVVVWKGS